MIQINNTAQNTGTFIPQHQMHQSAPQNLSKIPYFDNNCRLNTNENYSSPNIVDDSVSNSPKMNTVGNLNLNNLGHTQ